MTLWALTHFPCLVFLGLPSCCWTDWPHQQYVGYNGATGCLWILPIHWRWSRHAGIGYCPEEIDWLVWVSTVSSMIYIYLVQIVQATMMLSAYWSQGSSNFFKTKMIIFLLVDCCSNYPFSQRIHLHPHVLHDYTYTKLNTFLVYILYPVNITVHKAWYPLYTHLVSVAA